MTEDLSLLDTLERHVIKALGPMDIHWALDTSPGKGVSQVIPRMGCMAFNMIPHTLGNGGKKLGNGSDQLNK
eukprot:1868027-Lingulodinium_polyedra.AAC.1